MYPARRAHDRHASCFASFVMRMTPRHLLVAVAITSALGGSSNHASAQPEVPPIHEFMLSAGREAASAAGSSILSELGKGIAAAAIDAYVPGLSKMLGLGGDPFEIHVQRILDAIERDGGLTRALIEDAWSWAKEHAHADVQSNFDAAMRALEDWKRYSIDQKIYMDANLALLARDFRRVRSAIENRPYPEERVEWLHAYAVLVTLTNELVVEHARVVALGTAFLNGRLPGEDLNAWGQRLTDDQRRAVESEVGRLAQTAREDLLLGSSLSAGVYEYVGGMARGTRRNGQRPRTDLEVAMRLRFTPMRHLTQALPPTWVYEVDYDDVSNATFCDARDRDTGWDTACNRYRIYSPSPAATRATFDGFAQYHSSEFAAYEAHQALIYEDMLVNGYGPVRVMLDQWWRLVDAPGYRDYSPLDAQLDEVMLTSLDMGADEIERILELTEDRARISVEERSLLMGYVLRNGRATLGKLADAVEANRDPLSRTHRVRFATHLRAVRENATQRPRMDRIYRGEFAAKFVAIM